MNDDITSFDPEVLLQTEAGTVSVLAALGFAPKAVNSGAPFIVAPIGAKVRSLEWSLPSPARQRGTTTISDADSFIAYLGERSIKTGELVPIYWDYDTTGARFHAVLNDDTWRDWRVHYCPRFAPQWVRWIQSNRKAMVQADFAAFVEDNAPDIIEPESAAMIEVSRTIEAKKRVNFSSGIRLSNGQNEITYEETIDGTAGKGKLAIPETFVIAVPVFVGGDPWKVTARLRYRINEGKLSMWYDLLRADDVVQAAVEALVADFNTQIMCRLFRGACDPVKATGVE